MPELAAGLVLNGNYRLVRQLGAGGMGSVWLADHLKLRAPVVCKFMAHELARKPEYVARFSREAAAAMQVRSPHVVQILDHDVNADGVPYIVMEWLEGRDLGQYLDTHDPMPPNELAPILVQAAKALTRAHERGIVHRDIKPENIFLCGHGDDLFVKILDFGIAKVTETHQTGTVTGMVLGSPPYMSPEQLVASKNVDARSDLWSLGVVVYEALSGRRPYDEESIGAMAVAVWGREMEKLSVVAPQLGTAFDEWLARACNRQPEKRFATAKELADAFLAALNVWSQSPPPAIDPARDGEKSPARRQSASVATPGGFTTPTPSTPKQQAIDEADLSDEAPTKAILPAVNPPTVSAQTVTDAHEATALALAPVQPRPVPFVVAPDPPAPAATLPGATNRTQSRSGIVLVLLALAPVAVIVTIVIVVFATRSGEGSKSSASGTQGASEPATTSTPTADEPTSTVAAQPVVASAPSTPQSAISTATTAAPTVVASATTTTPKPAHTTVKLPPKKKSNESIY